MRELTYQDYFDRVYGAFLGKTVAGTMGEPFEGVKMPLDLRFEPGMVDTMLPNDDLDLPLLWLDVLELDGKGADFTPADLLERFVTHSGYAPGEYAIMRKNWNKGILPPVSGHFCNDFYLEGMGATIRSELWAAVAPGNPALAAEFAARDAILDHRGEGVYAEQFLAAMGAEAFFETDVRALVQTGLSVVPAQCRLRELAMDVLEWSAQCGAMRPLRARILRKYGHPDCTSLFENMGFLLGALLLSGGRVVPTAMNALNCGFDTDSTCSIAAAILGFSHGAEAMVGEFADLGCDIGDIRFVAGVQTARRGNRVRDLAVDICAMGLSFMQTRNTAARVTGAPAVPARRPSPPGLSFRVEYQDDFPSIELGGRRGVSLFFRPPGGTAAAVAFTLQAPEGWSVDCPETKIWAPAGGEARAEAVFSAPENVPSIADKNLVAVRAECGGQTREFSFGISGAQPWKVMGPMWRTEPVPYGVAPRTLHKAHRREELFPSAEWLPGDVYPDVLRRFSLNFKPDLATEFIPAAEWFKPAHASAGGENDAGIFHQAQDVFDMGELFGFRGPCTAYLTRILVSPEEMEVYFVVGASSPFVLWLNGEEAGRMDWCEAYTKENRHLGPLKLNKGENRLVWRLTRVNADAKYSFVVARGPVCAENLVCFASINPRFFNG